MSSLQDECRLDQCLALCLRVAQPRAPGVPLADEAGGPTALHGANHGPSHGDDPAAVFDGIDWQALLGWAGDRLVLPSLLEALERWQTLIAVPDEILVAVRELRALNAARNTRLLTAFEEVAGLLAQRGHSGGTAQGRCNAAR